MVLLMQVLAKNGKILLVAGEQSASQTKNIVMQKNSVIYLYREQKWGMGFEI